MSIIGDLMRGQKKRQRTKESARIGKSRHRRRSAAAAAAYLESVSESRERDGRTSGRGLCSDVVVPVAVAGATVVAVVDAGAVQWCVRGCFRCGGGLLRARDLCSFHLGSALSGDKGQIRSAQN